MASSRYSQTVDLESWNSSHSLAVLSVPPGSRVLDLGAADGSVARALKKRGCTVWGIEVDAGAAEAASYVCDRVIVADLEADDAFDALANETFDVVLALEVLEHLRAPALVLKRAASHLTEKGIAIVSIPNVTHGAIRLSLLEGRFTYTEQGLLDRTHLRFFDRQGAERLIGEAGLTISQRLRVSRELEETEVIVDRNGVSSELLKGLADDPDATTYQFVFVARKQNSSPESTSGGMLSERLLTANETLLKQFRELEKYAKGLEADLAAADVLETRRTVDELREELARRVQEAHRVHLELKRCKEDVAIKEAFIANLREQLLPIEGLGSEREERLSARLKQLGTRRDELIEARRRLLVRQAELEKELRALRTYTNSAGFRLVEGVIRRLRSFPRLFTASRGIVRKMVGRKDVQG